jgi:hypothetical protein
MSVLQVVVVDKMVAMVLAVVVHLALVALVTAGVQTETLVVLVAAQVVFFVLEQFCAPLAAEVAEVVRLGTPTDRRHLQRQAELVEQRLVTESTEVLALSTRVVVEVVALAPLRAVLVLMLELAVALLFHHCQQTTLTLKTLITPLALRRATAVVLTEVAVVLVALQWRLVQQA